MADFPHQSRRTVRGEAIQVGGSSVTPVAEASVRRLSFGGAGGAAGLAQFTARASRVEVRTADGREKRLNLYDGQRTTLAALAGIGAVVTALCALICRRARRG